MYNNSGTSMMNYTGMRSDIWSGLYDSTTGARELNIASNRWLSMDPDRSSPPWSQYAMTSNPNSFTDPSGLFQSIGGGGCLDWQGCGGDGGHLGGDLWWLVDCSGYGFTCDEGSNNPGYSPGEGPNAGRNPNAASHNACAAPNPPSPCLVAPVAAFAIPKAFYQTFGNNNGAIVRVDLTAVDAPTPMPNENVVPLVGDPATSITVAPVTDSSGATLVTHWIADGKVYPSIEINGLPPDDAVGGGGGGTALGVIFIVLGNPTRMAKADFEAYPSAVPQMDPIPEGPDHPSSIYGNAPHYVPYSVSPAIGTFVCVNGVCHNN